MPVALVTGGSRGLGREICRQLAELGYTVLLGARDAVAGEEVAARLRANGGDIRVLPIDVTDAGSVDAAVTRIAMDHGQLDVLVNNAGVMPADRSAPSEVATDQLRSVYETNVFGVVTVTNAMLPLLRKAPSARIVNQSSSMGSQTLNADPEGAYAGLRLLAYNTSKAALNAITLEYAKELRGSSVVINASDPGYCATDLTGYRSSRTAAEGARIAVRLATLPDAGAPTGTFTNDAGAVSW